MPCDVVFVCLSADANLSLALRCRWERQGDNGFHCRRKMMKKNVGWKGGLHSFVTREIRKVMKVNTCHMILALVCRTSNSWKHQKRQCKGFRESSHINGNSQSRHMQVQRRQSFYISCHIIAYWSRTITSYMSSCYLIASNLKRRAITFANHMFYARASFCFEICAILCFTEPHFNNLLEGWKWHYVQNEIESLLEYSSRDHFMLITFQKFQCVTQCNALACALYFESLIGGCIETAGAKRVYRQSVVATWPSCLFIYFVLISLICSMKPPWVLLQRWVRSQATCISEQYRTASEYFF